MELLYAIIAMLLAITISDILYEILEKVPLIFIQIFMGYHDYLFYHFLKNLS